MIAFTCQWTRDRLILRHKLTDYRLEKPKGRIGHLPFIVAPRTTVSLCGTREKDIIVV